MALTPSINPLQRPILVSQEGPDISVELVQNDVVRLGLKSLGFVTGIGPSAFTQTTDPFSMPPNGTPVIVRVNSTDWTASGLTTFVDGAGWFDTTVVDAQHLQLTPQNVTQLVPERTAIPAGTLVTSAGAPGLQGPAGADSTVPGPPGKDGATGRDGRDGLPGATGSTGATGATGSTGATGQAAFCPLTSPFSMPNNGADAQVVMQSTAWLAAGAIVYVSTAGWFSVTQINNATNAVLTALNVTQYATAGQVVNAGVLLAPSGYPGAKGDKGDPGLPGVGSPGATGPRGQPAFSTTTQAFTMPANGATATVNVADTTWAAVNAIVLVANAGWFTITSIAGPQQFTLRAINVTQIASVGATIDLGALVSPSGPPGPQGNGSSAKGDTGASGPPGPIGLPAYTTTTTTFSMPASGDSITLAVNSSGWSAAGSIVYVATAGWFSVVSVPDGGSLQLLSLAVNQLAAAGTAIASGVLVSPSGFPGATGPASSVPGPTGPVGPVGTPAYSTTLNPFTMPAAGDSFTLAVGSTDWAGQYETVFIVSAGWFSVVSVASNQSLQLLCLSISQVAGIGATIASGVLITPCGLPGPQGSDGPPGSVGQSAFTVTMNDFTMPDNGVTMTNPIYVQSAAWASAGAWVLVATAGWFTVAQVNDPQHLTLKAANTVQLAAPGTPILAGATVSPSGAPGNTGATGPAGTPGSNINVQTMDVIQIPAGASYSVDGTLMQSTSGPLTNLSGSTVSVTATSQPNNPASRIWQKTNGNPTLIIPPNSPGTVRIVFLPTDTQGLKGQKFYVGVTATGDGGIGWPVGNFTVSVI